MGSKMEACAECTKSCLSLHRTKTDPYPIVSSFFKVMFGKQFSKELIVPPKFGKTLTALKGKNTYLEDSTGQKWSVGVSNVKGNLVFRKGWREFSADHGIEMGDFLVFHYFKGSHFLVQIFTRSGCEKPVLFGEKEYQNKRSKVVQEPDGTNSAVGMTCKESPAEEVLGNCARTEPVVEEIQVQENVRKSLVVVEDVPSQDNINKGLNLASAEDFLVDPIFMYSRITNIPREDERGHLFDLSAFEMSAIQTDADKTSIIKVNGGSEVINSCQNTKAGMSLVIAEEGQIAEEKSPSISNEACLSEKECDLLLESVADVDMPASSNVPQEKTIPKTSEDSAVFENHQMTGGVMKLIKKDRISGQEVCVYALATSPNVSGDNVTLSPGKESVVNNGDIDHVSHCMELAIIDEDLDNSYNKMELDECITKKPIKSEVVEFCDSSPAAAIGITCSVHQLNEPFLELPGSLPVRIFRNGAKAYHKLVFLRDPARRLWPVVYHERQGFKTLTNGWKEFRESNSIQMGDTCNFVVENAEDHIFYVEILRC